MAGINFSDEQNPYMSSVRPIIKQKDSIDYKTPTMQRSQLVQPKGLKDSILAAIKITNSNLINVEHRLQYRTKKEIAKIIGQTEALSIFKGNIIKVFKQIFSSPTINRIKRAAAFKLQLDSIHPVIGSVDIVWLDNIEWIASDMKQAQMIITEAFANLTEVEVQEQAIAALGEYEDSQINRPTSYQLGEPSLSIEDINLNNIKNIKFI